MAGRVQGSEGPLGDKTGPELMRATQETSNDLDGKPYAIGRAAITGRRCTRRWLTPT